MIREWEVISRGLRLLRKRKMKILIEIIYLKIIKMMKLFKYYYNRPLMIQNKEINFWNNCNCNNNNNNNKTLKK